MAQKQGTLRSSDNKNNVISENRKGKKFGNDIGGVHRGSVASTRSFSSSRQGRENTFPVVIKRKQNNNVETQFFISEGN